MKKKSLTLFAAILTILAGVVEAQTPVINRPVQIITPAGSTPNNIVVNRSNGLIRYDPSATVKYTFFDAVRFTQVTARTLPQENDYISLYCIIGGKVYTPAPQINLSVAGSTTGLQGVTLVPVGGSDRTAGIPTAPTMWKLTRIGGGLAITYSGAFSLSYPEVSNRPGGYLGFQSGQVKISGNGTGITAYWQLQTVADGSNTFLRLQNSGDNKYFGYSYMQTRSLATGGGSPAVGYAGFAVNDLAGADCAANTTCDVKWLYKIYKTEVSANPPYYRTSLSPGTFMVNLCSDERSLADFGGIPVFGQTNRTADEDQWKFEPTNRGTYFIFSKKTGKALGVNQTATRLVTTPLDNNDFYYADTLQWILYGPLEGRYTMLPYLSKAVPNTSKVLACRNRGIAEIQPNQQNPLLQQFVITSPAALWGYVDMHTHPMSNFGFGRQFFFGAADGDIATALGDCSCDHGEGPCSNLIRNKLVDVIDPHTKGAGYPNFDNWPKQTTTTHQQMWFEWIDRARRGGLRTIIALAQSSHTLADGLETNGSYDDLRNMNTQINELILFVGRHPALMDTVTTAARMRSVVQAGKLAVIIGIEMDNIGNFYSPNERRSGEVYNPAPTAADVKTEIDRLYNLGVRYVLPIHVINNVFGGSAVYGEGIESLVFNISNYYDTNNRFDVDNVSTVSTGIGFRLPNLDFLLKNNLIKDVINVIRSLPVMPVKSDVLDISRYSYPDTARNYGHMNKMGLSALGIMAVKYMMSKGIMIDVDHMSQRAVTQTMQFGTEFNYPINSGHNGPRGVSGSEKTRTDGDYATIARLGGMVGVGTGDADPAAFVNTFGTVFNKVGGKNLTIGTDVGVGAKLPKAPAGRGILRGNVPGLEPCHTGNKTWDYNTYNSEGVDHYGMMPEFIKSLDEAGMSSVVKNELFSSAEYFAGMWEKCERNKVNVR